MPGFFESFATRVAHLVLRRPPLVIAAVGLLALAGSLIALRLEPDSGIDALSGQNSQVVKATNEFADTFGGDPIVILVRGDLPRIVLSSDLGVLAALEGCLAGNSPPAARPSLPQPCREIAEVKPARAVYGPGTFVNAAARSVNAGIRTVTKRAKKRGESAAEAAAELALRQGKTPLEQQQAADAARQLAQLEILKSALQLGQQYGLSPTNPPTIDNAPFVSQLVFDPASGARNPKGRFAYLFPNSKSALIQLRPRASLTPRQREGVVDLVRRAIADPKFQLEHGKYLVTGAPVVLTGLEDSVQKAVLVLLIAALAVMALVLIAVFPAELRLLPLMLALMTAGLTFGLLKLTGAGIGVGSVAVLPILVGLAVDYAIQFHARADRALRDGAPAPQAALTAARTGAPAVLSAAFATMAALVALALSPVPLVRGFALLLVAGVAIAIAVVLTAGIATLGWAGAAPAAGKRRSPAAAVAKRLRIRGLLAAIVRNPARTVLVVAVVALGGWTAGLLSPVTTDFRQLAPGGLESIKDIETLEKTTGLSGEVDVLVKARDATSPRVISWMQSYQQKVLADAGFKGRSPRCEKSSLCPSVSITELFAGQELTTRRIRALLKSVGDFSRGVVSDDRKFAALSFGIRIQSLSDQKDLIEKMRDRLDPPSGVTAKVVGLSAIGADAGGALSDPLRRLATIAIALLLAFLVMLLVLRSVRNALAPLLTVLLAGGISSLLLFVIRVPLNPMSAALNVFVIAIAAEFTILIYMQYLRERATVAGDGSAGAIRAFRAAYRSIGPAVFASAATAIAGFLALAVSDIAMLRDFALVAVVDLAVSLAAAVLVLPAVSLWLDVRPEGATGR